MIVFRVGTDKSQEDASYRVSCRANFLPPWRKFRYHNESYPSHLAQNTGMVCFVLDIRQPLDNNLLGGKMPSIHIDNVGDMAIIECAGRFVRTEGAFKL